jgi:hypothetical protein
MQLKPDFPHTDIIGALLVASQLFKVPKAPEKKLFIIFSDMRQSTKELDLDSRPPQRRSLAHEHRSHIILADLGGVHVYALGVDGEGKPIAVWQDLRQFWYEYFQATGASLCEFSIFRDVSNPIT